MTPNVSRIGPVEATLAGAVSGAIENLDLRPEDGAAVRLATRYAEAIDAATEPEERAQALDRLGPKLLAALAALGMTPQARAALGKGGATGVTSKLEALRARRQA